MIFTRTRTIHATHQEKMACGVRSPCAVREYICSIAVQLTGERGAVSHLNRVGAQHAIVHATRGSYIHNLTMDSDLKTFMALARTQQQQCLVSFSRS